MHTEDCGAIVSPLQHVLPLRCVRLHALPLAKHKLTALVWMCRLEQYPAMRGKACHTPVLYL